MYRYLFICVINISLISAQNPILQIDSLIEAIDSDTAVIIEDRKLTGLSTESGELKLYYDDDKICKLIAILYGETGQHKYKYYYQDDSLIFVLARDEIYKQPLYIESLIELESVIDSKYYFRDGELIKWLENDSINRDVNTQTADKIASDLKGDKSAFLKQTFMGR